MAFFKRELGPIERFENALKEKLAARQKLAERLSVAEAELAEKRAAAERLAVAGAANARLDRAEAAMRAVEDRTKTMRAELLEFDEQVASAERALADAKAQRDRDAMADQIEAMAAAIERAAPGFDTGATALADAVTKSAMSIPEATRFSSNVDAVRREVLAAADLICWELRSAARRSRCLARGGDAERASRRRVNSINGARSLSGGRSPGAEPMFLASVVRVHEPDFGDVAARCHAQRLESARRSGTNRFDQPGTAAARARSRVISRSRQLAGTLAAR